MTNFAANFKKLRKRLGLSQAAAGDALKVTQAAVSKWEMGGEIKRSTIPLIAQVFECRAEWLEYGTGEMFTAKKENEIQEDTVKYADPYALEAVHERFTTVVKTIMIEKSITQKEICLKWKLNYTQFNDMMNGTRDVSMSMVTAALQFENLNANYLLSGHGPVYERDYVNEEIKKLAGMVEEMRHPAEQKKRA